MAFELRQKRIVLNEFYWNINQVEQYANLVFEESMDHEEYIDYLQRCNKLPVQLRTDKLYNQRLDQFLSNQDNAIDANNKQEVECNFLLTQIMWLNVSYSWTLTRITELLREISIHWWISWNKNPMVEKTWNARDPMMVSRIWMKAKMRRIWSMTRKTAASRYRKKKERYPILRSIFSTRTSAGRTVRVRW